MLIYATLYEYDVFSKPFNAPVSLGEQKNDGPAPAMAASLL
jgi:hypothetical protein